MALAKKTKRPGRWALEYRDHLGRRKREIVAAKSMREVQAALFDQITQEVIRAIEIHWQQLAGWMLERKAPKRRR